MSSGKVALMTFCTKYGKEQLNGDAAKRAGEKGGKGIGTMAPRARACTEEHNCKV